MTEPNVKKKTRHEANTASGPKCCEQCRTVVKSSLHVRNHEITIAKAVRRIHGGATKGARLELVNDWQSWISAGGAKADQWWCRERIMTRMRVLTARTRHVHGALSLCLFVCVRCQPTDLPLRSVFDFRPVPIQASLLQLLLQCSSSSPPRLFFHASTHFTTSSLSLLSSSLSLLPSSLPTCHGDLNN